MFQLRRAETSSNFEKRSFAVLANAGAEESPDIAGQDSVKSGNLRQGKFTASATENIPPSIEGKVEMVG